MPNLTAVIGANTSKFTEEIKSAQYMLEKFVTESKNAKNAINDNVSVTNEQVNAYKNVIKQLDKVASGTANTKQQQALLSSAVKELKIQWANLSETAKSGDFGKMLGSTLTESQSALTQLTTQVKQAEAEMGNFGGGNVKRQLMEMKKSLTNLTAQYRAMSDAEKQSAAGRELAQKMDELREKAGTLKDTVGDVQDEIEVLASDTPNLDVFNELIGISADTLSTYSSVIAKVTGDEQALKNAISTVMAVQSAANLMTKVTNALQSSSVIMLKVRKVQELAAATAIKIKTAAEGKGTIATKAATAAQVVFNAVAKANPYVLLATVILGVGAALISFSKSLNEASEAEKQAQRDAEELKAKQEHLRDNLNELNDTSAKTKVKFYELQTQYQSLKTVAEKQEWIKNNQSAFNDLGISVYSVKTAEDVFINNTDAVCQALLDRAIAAKRAEQAANDLIALDKKRSDKSRESGHYYTTFKKGDSLSDAEAKAAGVRTQNQRTKTHGGGVTTYNTYDDYTDEEVRKVNQYRNKQALQRQRNRKKILDAEESELRQNYQDATTANIQANKKLATFGDTPNAKGGGGHSGGGSNTSSNKPTFESGSLSDLENQLSDLQKKYKDGLKPNLSAEDYKKEVKRLENEIESKKIELGIIPKPAGPGSLEYISKQISEKENALKLAVDNESRQNIQKEINELKRQKDEIELVLKPVVEERDIKDLQDELNQHQLDVKTNIVESSRAMSLSAPPSKGEIAQLNADLLKEELIFNQELIRSYKEQYNLIQQKVQLGAQITSNEKELVNIYDEATEKVDKLGDAYEKAADKAYKLQLNSKIKRDAWEGVKNGVNALGDLNSSVKSTVDGWTNLTENWEDMSAFEQVTSAFEMTISTIQNVIKAFESISQVVQMFTALSKLFTQQKIANDQAENQSEIGKLGVKQGSSIANATESGSKLPFPANIAAIAAGIAAVVAAFAMVFSSFAGGGIVGGNSTIGDYNLARVNKGEMILNGTQQKRLFNLLNNSGGYDKINDPKGNVTFTIKGQKLQGVLRNYNSKRSRI